MPSPQTLYDKLWAMHEVRVNDDGTSIIYIDRHLVHEVTSPQPFESLRLAGRDLWRSQSIVAVPDHNVPSTGRMEAITDSVAKLQVTTLQNNVHSHGITFFDMNDARQGIVHVVGPEQGVSLPGMTIVCGDSHTSTHGAFSALAFGIGTSQVEHVMATQTLVMKKAKNIRINVNGELGAGVSAKDIILTIIGKLGVSVGTGATIELAGDTIRALSVEARMTMCNMAIEAGARTGLIAVDDTTINYFKNKPYAPKGELWEKAECAWRELVSDEGAVFDEEYHFDATQIAPQVSWGTSPHMVLPVTAKVPSPEDASNATQATDIQRALDYMGLTPHTPIQEITLDKVFIGSCTNSRIEDLRSAAMQVRGQHIAPNIKLAMVVPGSGQVKRQAEAEGLDKIFTDAGFEWRQPSCSMCLAMNDDKLAPQERCASTSNRNFEGRQGLNGRTHLVSPAMAAAAAVAGHFVDVRGTDTRVDKRPPTPTQQEAS